MPGIPLVNALKIAGLCVLLSAPAFAGRRDLNFKYDGHWNARGHQAAANAVVAEVSQLLQ